MTPMTVTLTNRDGAQFDVDPCRALLASLRDQGVDLPYGCEYDGCVTCAAELTAGGVDQRGQVALKNRDIKDSYVILCVARTTEDITLEIGVENNHTLDLAPLKPHEPKADIATSLPSGDDATGSKRKEARDAGNRH